MYPDFYKVVRPGTLRTHGGRGMNVFCKIEYKGGRLSISGVEGPLASGNCLGSCGQIDMHQSGELSTYADGWSAEVWREFLRVWSRWHLNDLRAGCTHQEAEKRETGRKFTAYPPDKQDVCAVCGYEYGSAWNTEECPNAVLAFLSGLPDADRQPAWV